MKIILLITVLESLVVALWLLARRQFRNNRFHIAAVGFNQPPILGDSPVIKLKANPSNSARWAFINDWHVDPQVDDRGPIWASAAASPGSPSSRRSIARRSHQVRYKEWSARRSE